MLDFLMIAARRAKRGNIVEVYPKFIIDKSEDLMIRGGDFHAVWMEETKLWSTDENDAIRLIDRELDRYAEAHKEAFAAKELEAKVLHMWDAESGMIDRWHKFCQKQMRDSFHPLDEKLIFSNMETKKEDYASKKLPYPLSEGEPSAWNRLMSVLYSPEERRKIEWAIGAVVSGDSKKLQKFLVLYGEIGAGKGTVLNIIQKLFAGYDCKFDAKSLGSNGNAFALEAFRSNPLVAIQFDGDLSRIEDNTRINSLVSHEEMLVNEKFKSAYSNSFKCFLFMGTNKPVKITDGKSGLIRRLIDVSPTGDKLPVDEYEKTMTQIDFELGAIARHCLNVYLENRRAYDNYIPVNMLEASNDFYNFMSDSYPAFQKEDGVTATAAWEMYKTYCDEAKVNFPLSKRPFREELKNYFRSYEERHAMPNGTRVRSWYSGFRTEKFELYSSDNVTEAKPKESWLKFDCTESLLDKLYANCPAQYASEKGTPQRKWDNVTTSLSELDTSKLHYVLPPDAHIVIDFDIPDEDSEKSFERNLTAAGEWPPTYAELSKSGKGIHLHYIYSGDASKLSADYAEHVEVKVFSGKSSVRRKLTKCNDISVATISSGLPLKGETKVVNEKQVKSEKGLRKQIMRNLNKEIHAYTKPSVDFIAKILNDAFNSGLPYDVTDMRNDVLAFAAQSTNHSAECVKLVGQMKFKSAESAENRDGEDETLIFFDVEVFPNLFVVCYKAEGEGKSVVKMINPSPTDIEELMRRRLVGFNCRKYDNHILYARLMGYTNEQLHKLSDKIVHEGKGFFGEAYNVSYTDIYDFSSKKQSLKKFEIELGIHHQELGLPWGEPVEEKLWGKVADYCANDVIATEATFHARKADFTARQILADVAGMTVNDTTNTLTTRIIFGGERHPQSQFNYRDMGEIKGSDFMVDEFTDPANKVPASFLKLEPEYTAFTSADEKKPIFPGYKYENGKSTYRGEEVGEGGYVYAEPGIYTNVALLDIASMHPSSIIAEELFGPYTARYKDILDARLAIKHGDFEKVKTLLDGKLAKYLDDESTAKDLAQALKIAINSVYGLTQAKFDNPFRDDRNIDNIVAKRGALFMVNLKHEVQRRGYTVAHIKTDSIKIPDATPEIIAFVTAYGKLYGYDFEHEATYDRMCLVNDAVYIAKYASAENCEKQYGYIPEKNAKKGKQWTATGTQFAVPYVFKTLFSHEETGFDDFCETKSVQKGALYLDMNEALPDVSELEKKLAKEADNLKSDEGLYLEAQIAKGHDYRFIGRVGQFCPMKPGAGGGILLRQQDDKFYAVSGTKGCRWMESEMVRILGKEADVDASYYEKLAVDAKAAVCKYGDFNSFVSDGPYIPDTPPYDDDDLPF